MSKTGLLTKLHAVQMQLVAPKELYNSFGGYKYRSYETILEAAKPLLTEHKAAILISDAVVLIGDRFYVQATASFLDIESGESVSVTALAREEAAKKGMDTAQVTGSTSSYARKYALNGLLAINDIADADADEAPRDAGNGKQATAPAKAPGKDGKDDVRFMTSVYAGTCKLCGGPIAKGDEIAYSKEGGARHRACYEGGAPAPAEDENILIAYYDAAAAAFDDAAAADSWLQLIHWKRTKNWEDDVNLIPTASVQKAVDGLRTLSPEALMREMNRYGQEYLAGR